MRCQLIVLAALSLECAIAQPAHHRHHHKSRRGWQDVDFASKTDYDFKGVDFAKAYAEGQAAAAGAPAPAPADNHAPAPAQHNKAALGKEPKVINVIPTPAEANQDETDKESKQDNGDSKSSDGTSSDKSSGGGDTISGTIGGAKGSFGGRRPGFPGGPTEDQYHGNIGVPYGSNMKVIDTGDIDKYKYTNTFKNTGSNPMTIQIWNKEGRDGAPQSGMGEEPNMKFTVRPGQSQAVAFDENTLAAFSRDCDRAKDKGNLPQCVWGELSFGSEMPAMNGHEAAKKWSGFNRSSIPAGANEILTITCTSCGEKAREETKSGKGVNTWETAADPWHRNGVHPGPAHLLTEMAI
ncbi:MAG: hypothetical protein Q9176_004667 [Flavoplaca citrina]